MFFFIAFSFISVGGGADKSSILISSIFSTFILSNNCSFFILIIELLYKSKYFIIKIYILLKLEKFGDIVNLHIDISTLVILVSVSILSIILIDSFIFGSTLKLYISENFTLLFLSFISYDEVPIMHLNSGLIYLISLLYLSKLESLSYK